MNALFIAMLALAQAGTESGPPSDWKFCEQDQLRPFVFFSFASVAGEEHGFQAAREAAHANLVQCVADTLRVDTRTVRQMLADQAVSISDVNPKRVGDQFFLRVRVDLEGNIQRIIMRHDEAMPLNACVHSSGILMVKVSRSGVEFGAILLRRDRERAEDMLIECLAESPAGHHQTTDEVAIYTIQHARILRYSVNHPRKEVTVIVQIPILPD